MLAGSLAEMDFGGSPKPHSLLKGFEDKVERAGRLRRP